jgi:iron complex outermembrane receptor protein
VAQLQNPNADLKWEQTSQFNVAFDYAFLDNRVSGSVEYYVKTTSDLLLEVPVPQPASVSTRLENIGKLRNRGLEVSLDALAVSRPNLTWRAGLVFTANRNKVVDLGGRTAIATGDVSGQGQSGQVSQRIMPGHPLGTFFGPEFAGVNASGQQLFNNYDPVTRRIIGTTTSPASDDFVVLGDANPDFILGLTSQVFWRKFDASFLIRGEVGQKVFNNTALVYGTKGNAKQNKNFLASALSDPTGIDEPSIFSSRWIEDGSFVRLQNVTVGYTFTLPGLAGGARSARVYVSGDNLVLLTGYSGLDPEVHTEAGFRSPFGTRLASRGTDYLTYPRPRTFTTGIRVAF